jgi:hypothetical protein
LIPRNRHRRAMCLADRYDKQSCDTGPPGWDRFLGSLRDLQIPSRGASLPLPQVWTWRPMLLRDTKYVYTYHSVCPLVRIGTLPTPLSPAQVYPPPISGGGGGVERLGESQFRRLEKKLSAHTLCSGSFGTNFQTQICYHYTKCTRCYPFSPML